MPKVILILIMQYDPEFLKSRKPKIYRCLSSTLVLWMSVFCLSSCAHKNQVKVLKLAHGLNTNHPVHRGIEHMAEKLAEKSSGNLLIEIYPSQQLGTERQSLELLQIGSLAMTKVSGAVLENFAPNMQVLGLPYVFRDREHAYDVFDGPIGEQLLIESVKSRLRGLVFFDAGQRSFYSKEPIRNPDDVIDKKIRVMESVTAMNYVRSLGGAPTPISWGELYTALQQGIVEGAENNPPSFYSSKHYEICKYYTLNEHTAVPDVIIISTLVWDALSDEEKSWIQSAADEAKAYQRKLWIAAEQEALAAVKKAGVEVIIPDKTLFAERSKKVLDAFKDDADKYDLIQRIQSSSGSL